MVNYLVATEKPVGLALNFGERKARPPRLSSRWRQVEIKRKTKDLR
jgi:hypothetical protein